MKIRTVLIILVLLLSTQSLYAKLSDKASFILKANNDTSFMNYEFHNLAYEAALKEDYENAYRIYLKLANKGDERAEYNIGMMFMNGLGVERKKMDAYKWLRRASKHGNKEATLYFKEMNDRYAQKHTEEKPKEKVIKAEPLPKSSEKVAVKDERNTSSVQPKYDVESLPKPIIMKNSQIMSEDTEKEVSDTSNLLYIIMAFIFVIFSAALIFFIKSSGNNKEGKEVDVPQNSLVQKAKMLERTYASISDYHTALLKQVNLAQLKADENKTKIYYMFIYGMIDYFCQLAKFSDTEQRRVFSTHMGNIEGKENLTAITQIILEGQRDHSMYHYQAAGGISAQAWNDHKSADALSMLKKVMTEKR